MAQKRDGAIWLSKGSSTFSNAAHFALVVACLLPITSCHRASTGPFVITIDAAKARHTISPYIYGASFATTADIADLNLPVNRSGGNARTRYNWKQNSSNHASDWFFESLPEGPNVPGGIEDKFVASTRVHGAHAMLTIPTIGWVAKLGPHGEKLSSFSVHKYGAQQRTDTHMPDAGNGLTKDGDEIHANNPNDAHVPADEAYQANWIKHLTQKWGKAKQGGVWCYLLDNEPGLWHVTHRDVHPNGATMSEVRDRMIAYGAMIKAQDPSALVAGPEEWSYTGALQSGADALYAKSHWWGRNKDRNSHGGMDYYPWLLTQMAHEEQRSRRRLLDILTVHYYPQGGEYGDDLSEAVQLKRNRSTRSLWDPDYVDESWVKDKVRLIPRMKEWVAKYYPGTLTGITEYNWGAENDANGATAQADLLGIFGRQGLFLANRWVVPPASSPTYAAMKLFRNYDNKRSAFGDISVADSAPDPDTVSSFAAVRSRDGALTVVVINKALHSPSTVAISIAGYPSSTEATAWQVGSGKGIKRLANVSARGGRITTTLPPKSVTLFVLAANKSGQARILPQNGN
ncbi:MAG TPA: glycoside hydrolase family 44 protein [Capsulimonadaceae bacterium]|jgi:hypothetical protein